MEGRPINRRIPGSAGATAPWRTFAALGSTPARRRQPARRTTRRVDWARILPFVGMHARLPRRVLGRREPGGRRRGGRAVRAAHVRHHRLLPPLFLAPHVQDLARRAVRLRGARRRRPRSAARSGGPPTTATTTSHSDQAERRALARPAWLPVVAHGLVPVAPALRARPRPRARPAALPRTALARPLRHPGAVPAGARPAARSAGGSRHAHPGARHQRRADCWCGASSSRPSPATTAPTRSTRCATSGAAAATRPATRAATTGCWR